MIFKVPIYLEVESKEINPQNSKVYIEILSIAFSQWILENIPGKREKDYNKQVIFAKPNLRKDLKSQLPKDCIVKILSESKAKSLLIKSFGKISPMSKTNVSHREETPQVP